MKLSECREALKTMPQGDPRRGKIIEEMERIKKWMLSQGYGGKSNGGTPGAEKRLCKHCKYNTLPIPVNIQKCSSCGNFYDQT